MKFCTALICMTIQLVVLTAHGKPIENPVTVWKFQTNAPIRGGVVAKGNLIYFGSTDGSLYSVDKASGRLLWKFQTQGSIASTPALAGNRLIFSSRDNFVYTLDASTGNVMWKFQMNPPVKFEIEWDYHMASPIIEGNVVLVGSGDSYLYALNLENGKVLWKFKTNGRVRASPLLSNNTIYQPSHDGFVYALNFKNGELLWKFETRGATLDGRLYGFDRTSIYSSPRLADSLLIFGSRDGNTYCVNTITKKVKWKFFYDGTWAMSTPVIENGTVYIGWSTNSKLSAIDVMTGKEKWAFKSEGVHYATPILRENLIYTVSGDGKIYCLDKENGKEFWSYKTEGSVYSTPWIADDAIYVGSNDGALYCIKEQEKARMAVFNPVPRSAMFRDTYTIESKIAPYLIDRGFEHLDSAKLHRFLLNRLNDKAPSVIVFPYQDVPDNILGHDPSKGLLRQYLDAGGKVLWFGGVPKKYLVNENGQFYKIDDTIGPKLLDLKIDFPTESGAYYCTSTQEGLNWGLPIWHTSAHGIFNSSVKEVITLANNEHGQSAVWVKQFTNRPGSGFVSARTWPWHIPFPENQLPLIYKLAVYGLE